MLTKFAETQRTSRSSGRIRRVSLRCKSEMAWYQWKIRDGDSECGCGCGYVHEFRCRSTCVVVLDERFGDDVEEVEEGKRGKRARSWISVIARTTCMSSGFYNLVRYVRASAVLTSFL